MRSVKRIEAIIRPERLDEVRRALIDLGHAGITVYDVKGHGIQQGVTIQWRGSDYTVGLIPKVSVVAVVQDHEVKDLTQAIVAAARTDQIGDGKIFITPVEEVIRIRTGENGAETV